MIVGAALDDFAGCVRAAHALFYSLFRDKIASLVDKYPADAKDKKGNPFWSGTKRFPRAAAFAGAGEPQDGNDLAFVLTAANLLAVANGLRPASDPVPARRTFFERSRTL